MAGHAIFKVGDTLINMGFGRLLRVMFVTVVTGILRIGLGVTALAGNLAFAAVVEGEGVTG
jgi:hypothetical protein